MNLNDPLERIAINIGYKEKKIPQMIPIKGEFFQVISFMPHKPKWCVGLKRMRDGARRVATLDTVRVALGMGAENPFIPYKERRLSEEDRIGIGVLLENRNFPVRFRSDGSMYEFIGVSWRAKRMPLLYLKDGEPRKCTVEHMQKLLKDAEKLG